MSIFLFLLKCCAGTFKGIDLTIPEQQELGYMALRDDFERVCLLPYNFVCDISMCQGSPW